MKRIEELVEEESAADAEHGSWWGDTYAGLVEKFSKTIKPAIKRDCFAYHWIGTLLDSDSHLEAARRIQGFVDLIGEHASVRYVETERELWTTKRRTEKFSDDFLDMLAFYKTVYPERAGMFGFSDRERECMRFYSASTMQELDRLINSETFVESYVRMM